MRVHRIQRTQFLHSSIENVWDYFGSPKNLQEITPKHMNFVIQSPEVDSMYQGQIIHYTLTPLFGIRMEWLTEITHVEKHKFFVDTQVIGPYSLWHHQHIFQPKENGVEMTDIVHYVVPLGIVGNAIAAHMVRKKVNTIFDYRHHIIEKKFNAT